MVCIIFITFIEIQKKVELFLYGAGITELEIKANTPSSP